MTSQPQVKLFESVQVLSHWDEALEKWYFSLVDVVQVLTTDSTIPQRYWSDLRRKLEKEYGQPYEKNVRLKMPATVGRLRENDVADVQTLLRLIHS
jgi:DNA-damage-inducible protein D